MRVRRLENAVNEKAAPGEEQRHAALAGDCRAQALQTPEVMPLYEKLSVTGACWDDVDTIASRRVGPILGAHLLPMKKTMLAWSSLSDLGKRRTSIICQLRSKRGTT